MALVDDFLNFIRTEYKPAPGEFLKFNRQTLVDKMKIRELAKERGARGVPPADAADLDTVEQEIVEAIRSHAIEECKRTQEQILYYNDRIKNADPEGAAAQMLATAHQSVAAFKGEMLQARADLDRARKEVVVREKALEEFRRANALVRPPHPPRGHFFMVAVLVVCFFLETIPNASFLSEGSEYGFIGGYAVAILFSFFNLGFSFNFGRMALPNLHHQKWMRKLGGLILSLLLLVLVLGVNLLAAHYRGAISSGIPESEAVHVAPQTILINPLAFFNDTKAILMVCLGLGCGFIAMLEGYWWSDPYPGYQRVKKHLSLAEDHWTNLVKDSGEMIQEIYEDDSKKILALQTALRDQQLILPEIFGNRLRLIESCRSHLRYLEETGQYLLNVYREANVEARRERKPRYFEKKWVMTGVEPIAPPTAIAEGARENWLDVGRALVTATRQLNEAHDQTLQWIAELERAGSAVSADANRARTLDDESRKPQPQEESVEGVPSKTAKARP